MMFDQGAYPLSFLHAEPEAVHDGGCNVTGYPFMVEEMHKPFFLVVGIRVGLSKVVKEQGIPDILERCRVGDVISAAGMEK